MESLYAHLRTHGTPPRRLVSSRGFTQHSSRLSAGFTLIEMLVVIGIVGVLSVIVITSQTGFNNSLILSNTAYDIALSIRNAETFGLGSRSVSGGTNNIGYGIHFDQATPSKFILFADQNAPVALLTACHQPRDASDLSSPDTQYGNCAYDAISEEPDTTNPGQTYVLGNGMTVHNICAWISGGEACSLDGGAPVSILDITFVRPNPAPTLTVNGAYDQNAQVTEACVEIQSPQKASRYIWIKPLGLVTVGSTPCE